MNQQVMFIAAEYHMHEPLPLHRVQEAIIDFCRGRQDAVVFGAQAVNVYVVSGTNDIFLKQVAANSVEHIPVAGLPA